MYMHVCTLCKYDVYETFLTLLVTGESFTEERHRETGGEIGQEGREREREHIYVFVSE